MAPNNKTKSKRKPWRWLLSVAAGVFLIACYFVFGPNTAAHGAGNYFLLHTGTDYSSAVKQLKEEGFISSPRAFRLLAGPAGLPARIRPGRYYIPQGASNFYIIRMLRSGRQSPVKMVVRKVRTLPDLARLLARQTEPDSSRWMSLFLQDTALLRRLATDTANIIGYAMPNTYEVLWNWPPQKTFQKLIDYRAAFWTDARKAAAAVACGSVDKAITLASVVEEESNKPADRDTVASVYLNRLRTHMRLQADPTSRYAGGDFSVKRITAAQTALQHPYNTYVVYGLPPGPICTPSEGSIAAVLHAVPTPYFYFAAKTDGSGTHAFAKDLSGHNQNAAAYHRHLDEQKK